MRVIALLLIASALPLCIATESLSSTSSINDGIKESLVNNDSHNQPKRQTVSDVERQLGGGEEAVPAAIDHRQLDGNDYADDEEKSSTRRALMKLKALMQHNRSSKGRKAGKRREGDIATSTKSKSRKGRTRPTKVEAPSLTLKMVGNEGQTVVVKVQDEADKGDNDALIASQFGDFPTPAPNNNVVKTLSPTFDRPDRVESFIPTSGGVDFPTLPPAPFFFDPDAPTLPVSPPTNGGGGGGPTAPTGPTQPSNRPPNNNNGSSIDYYYTKDSKYSRDDGWNAHHTTSSSSHDGWNYHYDSKSRKSSKRGRPWRYHGKSSKSISNKSGKGSSGKWWSSSSGTSSSSSKSSKGSSHGSWSSSKSSKA